MKLTRVVGLLAGVMMAASAAAQTGGVPASEVFLNYGTEAVSFSRNMKQLADLYEKDHTVKQAEQLKSTLLEIGNNFFKNYNKETDRKLFVALMKLIKAPKEHRLHRSLI